MSTITSEMPRHVPVAIIGAGPAGLTVARLLELQGIDSVILERSSRTHVEQRLRAGVIEQPTVDLLTTLGVADRLHRESLTHNGFYVRFDGSTHNLDFHRFTGGHATVYGQHELVKDLIAARLASAGNLFFDVEVTDIDPTADRPEIRITAGEQIHTITADYVIGADGFHGAGRRAIPSAHRRDLIRAYPMSWLGILAESTPVAHEGMYCPHPHGLSVHSMRGPKLSRQYLQVPADTRLEDWSDDAIWAELEIRAAADDAPPLERGPIIDRSIAPLRSYVAQTMQYGKLFLIGDAAHIVPPTGAKGLNLAIGDAAVLGYGIAAAVNHGDPTHLADFTATALPRIMQAQRFSALLTQTLHAIPGADEFDEAVRRATLERWVTSEAAQRELGEVYLGLPFARPGIVESAGTPLSTSTVA